MARKDLLPKYSVKVEGGSGCLFQPINDEYSYVLTAKHVISGNNAPSIIRQTLDENDTPINETIEIIGMPFLHSEPNKDAAIIKVKKIEGIDDLIRDDLKSENREGYYLCGHPKSRANNAFSWRENKISIENRKEFGYFEGELDRVANREEVIGQSGGGIIKIEESCFLLAGIQKKMTAPDVNESLGRVDFMPLSFFDEIISENQVELSALFPPYIGSFERLLNDIFPLPNLEYKRALIQNELKKVAKELCEDFSPKAILEIFKDEFLVKGTEKSINNHKQLWSSFLELLTYNQLHSEEKLTMDCLKELHKKRKLFIVDSNSWTKKINEIFSSDLSDIQIGGSIVVCATNEKVTTRVEFSKEELKLFIPDISTPIDPKNISNTVNNPFEDLKLVNIFKFQDYIIKNILQFQEMNVLNSRETIKINTNGIL
jgi:hypothetical protein